jgi:hypothetical protein
LPIINYAQLTLPHESISISPAMLLYGYKPRTSFDWNALKAASPKEKLNQEKAQNTVRKLQKAWEIACKIIKKA